MVTLRSAALVVRFLLELALLAGAVVAAFALLPAPWDWVVAIVAPVGIVTVWSLWLSPRARLHMPRAGKLALETLLFVAVAVALWLAGHPVVAIVGLGIWVAHRVVLAVTPATSPFERDSAVPRSAPAQTSRSVE